MDQLPKLVRDRLQQTSKDRSASTMGEHPDSDLLTAFVERSLSDRERNQVAGHLFQCRECRDGVAVAAPEVTAASPAPRGLHGPQPWFRWPALRWGALAASLVIVGAAVMIGTRTNRETASVVTFPAPTEESSPQPPAADKAMSEVPGSDKNLETKREPNRTLARSEQPRKKVMTAQPRQQQPGAMGGVIGAGIGSGIGGGVGAAASSAAPIANDRKASSDELQKFASKDMPANSAAGQRVNGLKIIPPAAPPTPPEGGTDQLARTPTSSETVIGSKSVTLRAASPMAQSGAVARAKANEHTKDEVATTSPAPAYANRDLSETSASAPAGLMPDLKLPKWSLSQDGLPQRSFDSGKSWEKIPIEKKNGFRALSANGMDIWVGGPTGLLYHSTDIGLHWTRVIPVVNAATLSADIVRIEFADAVHGKVMTSTGETWTTSDQGKTWARQ
jgi:hypothetical protein